MEFFAYSKGISDFLTIICDKSANRLGKRELPYQRCKGLGVADNKPVGDGVRVFDDGNIKFVKKVLSNGVTVELKFDGDKIFVSKYDENGELISENTSNLMYF